ncbi:putative transporter subunit: ATP-binding component of ABC superfamily [Nostocoides japonicum T1-X7]|uniref:Putative transporter subunit: ATP-binding component of ABC superfamily n=1 Tax=Nostocoides japonicum T1-X7 TaxID=1194083 RepID=A0A077LYV4_9MICO|nr:ATP-binding cassette domain-containing protein [Tetrasphaera japonica]CCH77149.1 putative transporter subunit: ATP-binding component of ABC superfamily [Tetrasphaera japonica T1-X7]
MTSGPAARVAGLSLRFADRVVLDGADLVVERASSVAVTGGSGSGKSSLLLCLLGLLRPDAGAIEIDGSPVAFGRAGASARLRREKVGAVFQDGSLLPELSPRENVALAGMLAGLPAAEAATRAEELLDRLGVPAGSRSVDEFSGGEQQRIAVARALMNRPVLLLADEPTGSLDPATRNQVCDALFALPGELGCGLVVVTHDPAVAARADRRLRLVDGCLVEEVVAGMGR